jgi:hypothetical protein
MSRWSRGMLGATIVVVTACDPLATNNQVSDVASISDLILPSPTVVLGDLMKDSTGADAKLQLLAYNSQGQVLTNEPILVTVIDPSIHVDDFGFVHGLELDSVGARVVAGAGALQTPQVRIPVTVHPDVASAAQTSFAISFPVPATDSTDVANWSAPLDLSIMGTGSGSIPQGAQGFLVDYTIMRSPVGVAGAATAYLIDTDASRKTSRDTTTSSGHASRRVVLRTAALASTANTDTIVVRATAKYAGLVIGGFPIDFTIEIKKKP